MKNKLIEKFMDVFSCKEEEAKYYANESIAYIQGKNPGCGETEAIHSLLETL
jgi:hypothetical protein